MDKNKIADKLVELAGEIRAEKEERSHPNAWVRFKDTGEVELSFHTNANSYFASLPPGDVPLGVRPLVLPKIFKSIFPELTDKWTRLRIERY